MSENNFDHFDQVFQAQIGQLTSGISPAALSTSYFSWLSQLAQSPGRMMELASYPAVHWQRCTPTMLSGNQQDKNSDPRFHSESWQEFPWNIWAENFRMTEHWWHRATAEVPGLPKHVERTMTFLSQQMLDALSPSNFVATSPDLFQMTMNTRGQNLIHGAKAAAADMQRKINKSPAPGLENFVVGENLAVTPGRVVFRNHLIELIQYAPQTKTVYSEPILILPAWIMKYYILDLAPENSLVNWLVNQGHTVFMVSWRNPDEADRNLGMDEYYRLGAMAAVEFVANASPDVGIHLTGYCLGGTLAMITAAAMASNGDLRLKSLSLLAAQADFTEAGELMLFITESEVAFLRNMMLHKGYLEGKQMAGTFELLHSSEMVWSKMVRDYMMGERRDMIDLMAWNADDTRLPCKMHSEYLEKLFLHNDFVEGRFEVEGTRIAPESIQLPMFAVGTVDDHVAPWRSVHKVHLISSCDAVTFVLTTGGHNAGIVSEPGHSGRSYHIHTTEHTEPYRAPNDWLENAEEVNGSWWPAWHDWLVQQSGNKKTPPPVLKKGLCAAPGSYILRQ